MSVDLSASHRGDLAQRLRAEKDEVAREVTDLFFQRHPEWKERYGSRGVRHGVQDALFHIDFLAGAVRLADPHAFRRYVGWTARMLEARGIAPHFLAENLQDIAAALRRTLAESGEVALFEAVVQAGLDELQGAGGDDGFGGGIPETAHVFLQALLAGNRRAAQSVAEQLLSQGRSVPEIYLQVVQPALYHIGSLWQRDEITVAQEHMATAITQNVLALLYPQLPIADRKRGGVLITGVEGELHQIGAHMVADVLESDGWEVRFLGTEMPHDGILRAVEEQEPRLVGISTTMLFNLESTEGLIAAIRGAAGNGGGPRVIVGGGAFRQAHEGWRDVGADGYAPDLSEAVELARKLSGEVGSPHTAPSS